MKKKEYNGFDFDDMKTAKRMKYLVVYDGDLDLNNAYGLRNKKELREFLKDAYRGNSTTVFEVKLVGIFKHS